jgi:uncharacterized membrane protein YeiB
MVERIKSEPVLGIALLGAAITALAQFGIPLSNGQVDALNGLAWAVLAVFARTKVTPINRDRTTQPA